MPSWDQVLKEIKESKRIDALDCIRRKYLLELHKKTKRNVICYYSGWLQKKHQEVAINDSDKNGLMAVVHKLEYEKGLDLILHTPGGEVAATESIVDYLQTIFQGDITAYIPQLAMSAGTMIACSCKTIVMGKQSNLGPIDPQFGGIPAYGVISEFKKACESMKADPGTIHAWQVILSKYHPTFLGECENAIEWSKQIVQEWLEKSMFKDSANRQEDAKKIVQELSSRDSMKSHSRHIGKERCKKIGLKITDLEDDQTLQDLVLTVHHSYMHTFANSPAIKIIENHNGIANILQAIPNN